MKNLFLYFSAFIPMYFLVLLKFIIEKINNNISFNVLNTIILCCLVLLIILGVIGLLWNIFWDKDEVKEIIITKKENTTDQHFLGYFSLFVLFALTFELTKVSMFVVSVFIVVFIGIVYVENSLFYINPFLNILGFKFYDISYKLKDDDKEHTAKIFYRGTLTIENQVYRVKMKNINFVFIDRRVGENHSDSVQKK